MKFDLSLITLVQFCFARATMGKKSSYVTSYSILFASSVNSVITRGPPINCCSGAVVCAV